MIGFVTPEAKAVVRLVLITNGTREETDVFVDTGFNGDLALPRDLIRRLNFQPAFDMEVQLADGSTAQMNFFKGHVLWNDTHRVVEIIASEGDPLLGMRLLEGSELKIEVKSGGAVTIEPL